MVFDGLENSIDRFIHVGKQLRIMEVGEFSVEIFMDLLQAFKAASSQNLCSNRMNAELFDDRLYPSWISLRIYPDGLQHECRSL